MKRNVLLIILCLIFSNGAIATETLSKLPFLQSMKGLSWEAAFEQVLKIKGCDLYAGQLQSIKDQKESKSQNEEVLAFRCFDKALVNTPVKVAIGFKLSKVNSIAIFAPMNLDEIKSNFEGFTSNLEAKLINSKSISNLKRQENAPIRFITQHLAEITKDNSKIKTLPDFKNVATKLVSSLKQDSIQAKLMQSFNDKFKKGGIVATEGNVYFWEDQSSKSSGSLIYRSDLILIQLRKMNE